MADETKDVTTQAGDVQGAESQALLLPPVDIFEDGDGITIVADMPGVSRDRLDLQVDGESLTVEGEARIDMPDGMQAVSADLRSTRYRRSFALSRELETGEIDASLKDGVLRVRIPKRAEVRPRKIEVNVG